MRVSMIAAVAENGVIGRDNDLPWRLPIDMKFFRRMTLHHHVITGRKNYEAMGRPLPKRENIVIARTPGFEAPGCQVVTTLGAALDIAREAGDEEAFIIGGAQIYKLALPVADRFYLTRVHAEPEGDVHFPSFDMSAWVQVSSERYDTDEKHQYPFTISTLERAQ
jgi:dihydrofolate reductase